MNSKLKLILGLLATAFWICTSHAQLIAYDPMNYTGSQINVTTASPSGTPTQTSGGGFTGNWAGGALTYNSAGLNYTGLPVAGGSISSLGANYMYEKISGAPSSGTVWASFLFKQGGDNGGNRSGVILEDTTGTGIMLSYQQYSGTAGLPCLVKMSSVNTGSASTQLSPDSSTTRTYANSNFYVLKLTYTSGVVSSVSVYSDPTAGQATAPTADFTVSSGLPSFGALVNIGLVDGSAEAITLDEFRVGNTFADVAGFVPPPPAPTGVTAYPGVNSVGLSWNAVTGATGYKVLRGTSSGVYTVTNAVASTTNFDTSVIGGTTYYYVVEATNSFGASTNSVPEVSATPTIALPGVPTGVTAVGTNGAVNLSWNVSAGAASYNVKRSTTSGAETTIANVATTSYSDTSVANGTPYYYEISATNNAGESANSSEVAATPNVPPAAPTGLTATAGSNQVVLAWTGSAGAVSYNIKRSTASGAEVNIGTVTAPTLTYTDTTAIKFTQYFYEISAVDAYGESPVSNEASATPTGAYGPFAYESFNYALGAFNNNTPSTATGFTGNWTVSGGPTIVAGLSYSNLPVGANAFKNGAAGAQTTVALANPVSSGTLYLSYLFKGAGDPGANPVGIFLQGNNATSLFIGFEGGYSAVQTSFGLGSVSSTALSSASPLGATTPVSNSVTHLAVVGIAFNTSGVKDTVSLWIDPPAGVSTPGVAANVVYSNFDVGTISGVGVNIAGAYAETIDEIRLGQLYGDVVGYGIVTAPTIPTTVSISVAPGEQVSWTAAGTNDYQPQYSSDDVNFTNVGGFFTGNAVSSIYQASPAPYYRVLELVLGGAGPNVILDGSFEIPAANNVGAANWSAPASTGLVNEYVTNSFDGLSPTDGTNMLYIEGQMGSASTVTSDSFPISGSLTYGVAFDAANPMKSGGGNPQFQIEFFDSSFVFISASGFTSYASAGTSSFTTISNNYTAPANAAYMNLSFLQAVGAGPTDHWISLVDNVRVAALSTFSSTNILAPTLSYGAGFTGTVQTNGVTAAGATGTLTFLTNSVGLSTNTIATGSASSANAVLNPPYTVTVIYSGDSTYIGSTNTLSVSGVSTTPTTVTATVSGGNLNLSWPSNHTGWILQTQTNSGAFSTNWYNVSGSSTTDAVSIHIDITQPGVYFRLKSP